MNDRTLKILNLLPLLPRHKSWFESAAPNAEFIYGDRLKVSRETVQQADVILGNPMPEHIKNSTNLKLIHLGSAGTDAFIKPGVLPPGVILTNSTGAYGVAVAEHMLSMWLCLCKNIMLYRDNQRSHEWRDRGPAKCVRDSVVLSVGMGDIGGAFAEMCHGLGAYVIGVCRTAKHEKPEYCDELYTVNELDGLLPKADCVALSLPNTAQTRGLFNAERFDLMKKDSIILNVGRGNAIVNDDLIAALSGGKLRGAGLEVTDPEPLPPDHPLWRFEKVVITPHISGSNHLIEQHDKVSRIASENLRRFVNDEPLLNVIDMSTGYRKL